MSVVAPPRPSLQDLHDLEVMEALIEEARRQLGAADFGGPPERARC